MVQALITARGYLAANPDYLPAKTAEDGSVMPPKLAATIYEQRSIRQADGAWIDDPRGPLKITAQLFGRTAETARRLEMRQGDPVIVAGNLADPDAFVSAKDGEPTARTVINARFICFDSIRLQNKRDREQTQQAPQPPTPANDTNEPVGFDDPALI